MGETMNHLESQLIEDIETALSTANEMAEEFGYRVGDEIIAEHYGPIGNIDALFVVTVTVKQVDLP